MDGPLGSKHQTLVIIAWVDNECISCIMNYRSFVFREVFQNLKFIVSELIQLRKLLDSKAVFLLRQIWIFNYSFKSAAKIFSNENINTGVYVVFKTKRELICQNKLFLKYHFFITKIIWRTFDIIIDNP